MNIYRKYVGVGLLFGIILYLTAWNAMHVYIINNNIIIYFVTITSSFGRGNRVTYVEKLQKLDYSHYEIK